MSKTLFEMPFQLCTAAGGCRGLDAGFGGPLCPPPARAPAEAGPVRAMDAIPRESKGESPQVMMHHGEEAPVPYGRAPAAADGRAPAACRGIFDRTLLGGTELPNRIFRAAVGDRTEDGAPGPASLDLYGALADGGAGSIVTGFTIVDELEKGFMPIFSLAEDRLIGAHRALTDLVHSKGARIFAQLVQIGSYQSEEFHKAVTPRLPFLTLMSPSGLHDPVSGAAPREITPSEIRRVQSKHAEAAARAVKAGYDGVEIHAAHGFLLSQFMQPGLNRREDDYGGSPAGRARMALETYRAVRSAVGACYPVLMKVNVMDGFEGGCVFGEVLELCRSLSREGLDAVETSGCWRKIPEGSGPFFLKEAGEMAARITAKVILTGGLRTREDMRAALDSARVEYLGVARPLMRDPDFVDRIRREDRMAAESAAAAASAAQ